MLFFILSIVLICAGWILCRITDEFYFFLFSFLGFGIFLVTPLISVLPIFYDTVENTETITTFSDNIYYQNDDRGKNITVCITDNDEVSHIEIIHYETLRIEYAKDITSAEAIIDVYQKNPKYDNIILDVYNGNVVSIVLRLPESEKDK